MAAQQQGDEPVGQRGQGGVGGVLGNGMVVDGEGLDIADARQLAVERAAQGAGGDEGIGGGVENEVVYFGNKCRVAWSGINKYVGPRGGGRKSVTYGKSAKPPD